MGLSEYSHVWLLFVCHQNTQIRRKKVKTVEMAEVEDSSSSSDEEAAESEEEEGEEVAAPKAAAKEEMKTIAFKNAKVAPPRAGGKKVVPPNPHPTSSLDMLLRYAML